MRLKDVSISLISGLFAALIVLGATCRTTPEPEPAPTVEGIPEVEGLRLAWEPVQDRDTAGVEVEVDRLTATEWNKVKEFRSSNKIPAGEEPYILIYSQLKELGPGKFRARIRLNDAEGRVTEWSDYVTFEKNW